jgi:hypothetical protein
MNGCNYEGTALTSLNLLTVWLFHYQIHLARLASFTALIPNLWLSNIMKNVIISISLKIQNSLGCFDSSMKMDTNVPSVMQIEQNSIFFNRNVNKNNC